MTALRPPELFPRPEVAALMLAADRVILADTLPFSRQAAHNRARVRASGGAQWLSVPRVHLGRPTPLAALPVAAGDWARKARHALRSAYGMAPYADHVLPEVDAILSRAWPSVGALAVETCRWTHRWLGAPSALVVASELPGAPASPEAIWEAAGTAPLLALEESAARDRQRLGATTRVLHLDLAPYRQAFSGWVPGCSSLDLVLNHGPRAADLLREATSVRPLAFREV